MPLEGFGVESPHFDGIKVGRTGQYPDLNFALMQRPSCAKIIFFKLNFASVIGRIFV